MGSACCGRSNSPSGCSSWVDDLVGSSMMAFFGIVIILVGVGIYIFNNIDVCPRCKSEN